MKHYELTYLISATLSEQEAKSLHDKINSFILENQGGLEGEKVLIKKKLESPVKKESVAYLASLNFYLSPEKLEAIESKLKSETQILNYIIITKTLKKKEKITRKLPTAKLYQKELKKTEKPKKVELKEIEQKLEEILGE